MMNIFKPNITLYCLPFAGGNALSYRDFQKHVADHIRIKPLDLPGHGKRIKEPLLTNIETIATDVLQQIQTHLNHQSYAIYGHSMGALLGYLLTQRILNAGLPAPLHLFVSGREAPSVIDEELTYNLPKPDFIKKLYELEGAPPDVLENAELMEFFDPILRADFQATETYIHYPTSPMNIPITVMYGSNDKETTYTNLLPWQQETQQPLTIKQFSGGHFFIFEHLPQIGNLLSQRLMNTSQVAPKFDSMAYSTVNQ